MAGRLDKPSVRTEWRMGKVIELVKGRDDQVRGAKLKVLSKSGKQKVLFRPLQKLIPFETSENRESEDQGESEQFEDNKAEDENQKHRRPRRTLCYGLLSYIFLKNFKICAKMYILIKFTCLVCSLSISRLFTLSRLAVLMSTQCRPFST